MTDFLPGSQSVNVAPDAAGLVILFEKATTFCVKVFYDLSNQLRLLLPRRSFVGVLREIYCNERSESLVAPMVVVCLASSTEDVKLSWDRAVQVHSNAHHYCQTLAIIFVRWVKRAIISLDLFCQPPKAKVYFRTLDNSMQNSTEQML